jgi:hypothetical protein
VRVEDEARRLALGAPELADCVPRLLAVLGIDPAIADALGDWTTRTTTCGRAASAPGISAGRRAACRRTGRSRRRPSLARARLDARALARLAPHVTVAPSTP